MAKIDTASRDGVLIVKINRPEVRNAVDAQTASMLEEAVRMLRNDAKLRVMILTGEGDISFCAGADLKAAAGLTARPGANESGPMGFTRIIDVQKPVIAAVNGYCLAGGLELACWCDFRIASSNARFGVVNRRWGVPLIDGGTQRLPRIVGLGNALYLIETGAMINADHALRMGLVQEVVPAGQALPRALELAGIMSAYPWTSLINDRRAAREGVAMALSEGLQLEKELHTSSLRDNALREGLQRFAEGQRPPPPVPPA
ncbi:MAG: enoyl-CoA hydratase/isomerase family protein [Dehalococcoidia bacterium]|nr:enoyl-CoA hydratase/isomerase family protein [Dehalococcoidia bacterium]